MSDENHSLFKHCPESVAAQTATPHAERAYRRSVYIFASLLLPVEALVAYLLGTWHFVTFLPLSGLIAGWYIHRLGAVHRRRRKLWRLPFPAEAEAFLSNRMVHFQRLDEQGRELFRQRAKVFLDEVVFHGAGMEVTDELRWRTAVAAVVPTLGFPEWQWSDLQEIVFRPEGYDRGEILDEGGVITEFEESGMVGLSGILNGVMMLSADDLVWEFDNLEAGENVGFHEFAHLMVNSGGLSLDKNDRANWERLLAREKKAIRRGNSLLDEYALVDADELFAVASELFFTTPHLFREWHGELYAVLTRTYRQDPCQWLQRFD